jgi:hypothetical protein
MSSIHDALTTLLAELLDGSAKESGWVLNPQDPGLIGSLSGLSAADASHVPAGGRSSVAAHVDHLRYGLSLMNRWSQVENPFADADWTLSWKRTTVDDGQWKSLLQEFRDEARKWQQTVHTPRELTDDELKGYVASVAHLAYHIGAIRQLSAAARGPKESAKG